MSEQSKNQTVTVSIVGGPTATVPWSPKMNGKQAIEAMWNQLRSTEQFTYGIQYYGSQLGYLVLMINETYDTFLSVSHPFFYWEFLVNGTPAFTGIDGTILNAGDNISFQFVRYDPELHKGTLVEAKYKTQLQALRKP